MCNFFSFCVNESKFPSIFKQANVTPAFKKDYRGSKENYRTVNILLVFAKYLESFLVSKEPYLWIKLFQNNNVVFGRVILHNTAPLAI